MRLPVAAKKKARIEIIPMIDTMFFLLVFFMIATLSMTLQKGMPVNLPTAGSVTDDIPEQISLTLTKKGELFFNKEPIVILDLEPRLLSLVDKGGEPSIVINADEAVPHGRVIDVMDSVRKSGIMNMAIATKPES
ncbi:MAG: biopolymer transporter ExbD [Nitrospirae bacterium]|nr:biopolymer transporter ExbD [Nitrospirota bacterium]